ncbi:hypothetical protein [Candidatus Viadribacter manganicus]|uniref:Uncharacterized protein n=1 Tax=Candidatus Viadribacter manganicus TaxID=1759059 RepID=A0A1B1ALV1_9PROT|nr:hypothetical protein [Candidatus Viadribacter manganicus]ANP47534.1 hypothetical protein ATE48_17300 [Candidatus Viadribacter manganicus]
MAAKDDSKPQKTLVEHAKGIAALPGEKFAELKAFGAEKLHETMTAFLSALPALRQAGYELREFEIELGLTPKIIAHFIPWPASEEDIAAARETLKANKIGASMLSVLRRAGDVHRQVKVPGFSCAHMEIDVGVIPAVRLRYRSDVGS